MAFRIVNGKAMQLIPDNPLGTIRCDFPVPVRPEPFGFVQESLVEATVFRVKQFLSSRAYYFSTWHSSWLTTFSCKQRSQL